MNRDEQREWLIRQAGKPGSKGISAMIRVKNEAEYLFAAVHSIQESCDEIVLIDNASDDASPQIIAELARLHPNKVRTFSYPHRILKVGKENWDCSNDPDLRNSPNLSANFYDWSLKRCTQPYVLKWDGDMIALPAFHETLRLWRESDRPVLSFYGLNVHPNLDCYVGPRCTNREALLKELSVPGLPWWVTVLTRDSREPRLFPRRFARYGRGAHWTQALDSPCTDRDYRKTLHLQPDGGCFLHMKFCKADPYLNYSADLARVIESNIMEGPMLDEDAAGVLRFYGLKEPETPNAALGQPG